MKKVYALIGVIIFFALGGILFANLSSNQTRQNIDVSKLPDAKRFVLRDYSDNIVGLENFAGKPLVINVWATWCVFCKEEMPAFANVQNEFSEGGEPKFEIVAINRAESIDTAKGFSDSLNLTNQFVFLLDPKDSYYRAIDGFSMPETLFVTSDGKVLEHKRGPLSQDQFRDLIEQLLEQS